MLIWLMLGVLDYIDYDYFADHVRWMYFTWNIIIFYICDDCLFLCDILFLLGHTHKPCLVLAKKVCQQV
jgi:hypothetical protein